MATLQLKVKNGGDVQREVRIVCVRDEIDHARCSSGLSSKQLRGRLSVSNLESAVQKRS